MDITQLHALGAIVPRKLIKRTITIKRPELTPADTWEDPEVPEFGDTIVEDTMDVHLRKISSADSIEVLRADERDRPFVAIARGVHTADGAPLFESVEQAMQLQLWIAMPLFEAIWEVAGMSPKGLKTSSGTNSQASSEDEASQNGSKPSRTKRK